MPKLSVVIPVYNTAPYLQECLDSVWGQTLEDIEVIIIDDGSTDGSTDICRRYAAKDARVCLVIQENMGVAAARKKGISLATAPYIAFVDSDDYIASDSYYEELLACMDGFDLAIAGWYFGDKQRHFEPMPQGTYQSQAELTFFLSNMLWSCEASCPNLEVIWNKLFRTDIAKVVSVENDIDVPLAEDTEFLCRYILRCTAIHVTDLCGYYHYNREGSANNSAHDDYLNNINTIYLSLKHAFQAHPLYQRLMEQLQRWTLWRLSTTQKYMGFSLTVKPFRYISPFLNTLTDKKVVLYGAGAVGQDYHRQMTRAKGCAPVIWVDKQHANYQDVFPISSVERLLETEFDFLIIAVKKKKLASSITQELLSLGIDSEKILWKEPIDVSI